MRSPRLRRASTRVRSAARAVPYRQLVLTARVHGGARRLRGDVVFTAGRRRLGVASFTGRGASVRITVPAGGARRIVARYGGDGRHAPSRASARP
jgi:hypothetical protein